jgi:pantetheine-phosphate adenylyltransferase
MAMMNFHLNPQITSLFMMPNEKYIHLNSSVIKEIAKNGGDVSPFVTNSVNDALLSKFSS